MEDDQQFCLRWNNHQSTLVAVFDTLLENGTLVDCTLAAEGKYLNAHKVVLSACSPYFESLLSQNYDKHPIFILKDVKFQELKAMMDYMYRGEVNISQDQLGALLKAAESLQIKGLSDNKKESEPRKLAPPAPAKSPPLAASTTLPKVQGLTIEQRRGNRSMDEREGSLSPGPRKRKRMRRRSTDDLDNHHDASNSSESHSNPSIQNIPIALPPASSKITNADVPEPVETKSEILSRHKMSNNDSEIPQVPIIKEKIETHSELMLEPKAEYVEEMNEDSIEDLTLDDDDASNLDMSNDGAGPSHGNVGEGSSQGFGGWHMGNQSQDEVFLAAQEAVGAHRDSQGSQTTQDIVTLRGDTKIRILNRCLIEKNYNTPTTQLVTNSSNVNYSFNSKDPELLDKMVERQNMIASILSKINDRIMKLEENIPSVRGDDSIFTKFDFPISSDVVLYNLENVLVNDNELKNVVKELSRLGGNDAYHFVSRVMERVITNQYAVEYSYLGKKKKKPFANLVLNEVIIKAGLAVFPDVTRITFEQSIAKWLRRAKERKPTVK